MTPREANFNLKGRYPHANSDVWLAQMRPSNKQMVKKLRVFLGWPREEGIDGIASGLAGFYDIKIEIPHLGRLSVPERIKQRCLLAQLCRKISEKRRSVTTVWHDSEDIENASCSRNTYQPISRGAN